MCKIIYKCRLIVSFKESWLQKSIPLITFFLQRVVRKECWPLALVQYLSHFLSIQEGYTLFRATMLPFMNGMFCRDCNIVSDPVFHSAFFDYFTVSNPTFKKRLLALAKLHGEYIRNVFALPKKVVSKLLLIPPRWKDVYEDSLPTEFIASVLEDFQQRTSQFDLFYSILALRHIQNALNGSNTPFRLQQEPKERSYVEKEEEEKVKTQPHAIIIVAQDVNVEELRQKEALRKLELTQKKAALLKQQRQKEKKEKADAAKAKEILRLEARKKKK